MDRPKCLCCGKLLIRTFVSLRVAVGESPTHYVDVNKASPWHGKQILAIKNRKAVANIETTFGPSRINPISGYESKGEVLNQKSLPPKWEDLDVWIGHYKTSNKSRGNYFCSDNCGVRFADACVRAGFRMS